MNQDKDFEIDKWDIILSLAVVISLIIAVAILGIQFWEF